jgi:hypothetical protein
MPFTYTYTARNKDNPNRVITFTIYEDRLRVNLTGLVDQVSEVIENDDQKAAVKKAITSQFGTTIYKAIEQIAGPIHLQDVTPDLKGDQLTLTFWRRLAGLRFAPFVLIMGEVDNPEAAHQFIDTLKERQVQIEAPNVFSGPLDYWATWIAMLIGLIVLIKWPRKKKS